MAPRPATTSIAAIILFALGVACAFGQTGKHIADSAPSSPPGVRVDKHLPDIVALMRDVETNERKAETVEQNYIYHSVATEQEFDSHGQVKKTTITESDHFWINGVPVQRTTKRDGRTLTPDELAKENEHIDKLAARSNERREKADAEGKETDARGDDEVSVSRLIQLGTFTNPRRVQLNGRDTIAVDFIGNQKAKAQNRAEEVIRDLAGTAWIDEGDHVLAKVEGRFANSFKIAGGLIANVQMNTSFSMVQTKINDEVWLPSQFEGNGSFHVLLFFGFNGSAKLENSDFRKFRVTGTVLAGIKQVDSDPQGGDSAQP